MLNLPRHSRGFLVAILLASASLFASVSAFAEDATRTLQITKHYLNIPIARASQMHVYAIKVDGVVKREFPVQLAEHTPDYWIFLDVGEFKGQSIQLTGPSSSDGLAAIYQADTIQGDASLYREPNRPRFHFTVKRGWSNDVNGPIFYHGLYHLFWQAFPFGATWDTGFMYWGHAVSKDLLHWRELSPALMLDQLGSPWSGTSLVDHDNAGGWGKDALVLVYTAYDRKSHKQVQSIAYSTDNAATFTRYAGNPILDTNQEAGSNDTRDPKVFWYAPTRRWVMVLFEKDGMSFFSSTDLKVWTRHSHFRGLHECPDFFELPIDGDSHHTRWILHGGSSAYYIGTFDGQSFTAESPELHYAEGANAHGDDALYAAQSFAEMPDHRRVQMAWGRIEGTPFNQMMLFPTEFKLVTTPAGLRLRATPIQEIDRLRNKTRIFSSLTAEEATQALDPTRRQARGQAQDRAQDRAQDHAGSLDVRFDLALEKDDALTLQYSGTPLATLAAADLDHGRGSVEVLIDKTVAEIFVNHGARYIVRELPAETHGLQLSTAKPGRAIERLQISTMRSIWEPTTAH